MKTDTIRKVNYVLHVLATHYMEHYQGDILLDQVTIIETLEDRGEIECYVATSHFDTEKRFKFYAGECTEQARAEARNQHWGDYIITLALTGDNILVKVENGKPNTLCKPFPFNRLDQVEVMDLTSRFTQSNLQRLAYTFENDRYIIKLARPFTLELLCGKQEITEVHLSCTGELEYINSHGSVVDTLSASTEACEKLREVLGL